MSTVGSKRCSWRFRSSREPSIGGGGTPKDVRVLTVPSMSEQDENETVPAVSVLIVDDQIPFRRAARMVVTVTPGFEVVGEAVTGEEAVEQFEALNPGLVLMDINLPGISGIEATRRITELHPEAVVLLLSTYRADDLPEDAGSCGATGYVNKEQFEPAVVLNLFARPTD